jgi:hypothetical protein
MKRLILLLGITGALTGCPNTPAGGDDAGTVVPEKAAGIVVNAPAGTAGNTAATPGSAAPTVFATGTPTIAPTAAATAPASSAPAAATTGKPVGGEQPTQAGGCQKDGDCPGGQVCEACKEGKCCASGCRNDASCPKGQHCKSVVCVRAPCPSRCQ